MADTFLRSRGAVADQPAETDVEMIVFKHVSLAFDDTVVLRDVSFTLLKGHTKIILGASGSGKSTSLKIITGLLRADATASPAGASSILRTTARPAVDACGCR